MSTDIQETDLQMDTLKRAKCVRVYEEKASGAKADRTGRVRIFPTLRDLNEGSAIELESGLGLRRSQAAALIAYREKSGKFKTLADVKKVPGIDAAKIDAKKDRIVF